MIHIGPELREPLERGLGIQLHGACTFVGVIGEQGVRGILGFDKISHTDCEMHALGVRGFMTHALLLVAGHWMFDASPNGWGVTRITARIPSRNTLLIRAALKAGFRQEGRQRKFYGTDDAIVLGLLASEYRYGNQQPTHRRAA